MFLGTNSGFNARDLTELQSMLTNAVLAVQMDDEREGDVVLRDYMERNVNHPNQFLSNCASILSKADDIIDRFNAIAAMVQLAE